MSIYSIRTTQTPEELEEVLALRHEIFVVEQGIPEEKDKDGKDNMSLHIGVFDPETGRSIGVGRLTPDEKGNATLSRIGVKGDHRGKGLGKRIIGVLEYMAMERGIRYVTLRPHAYLEEFYQNLGYKRLEGQEDKVGKYDLITMGKELESF